MASFVVASTMASSVALIQIPFFARLLHLQPLHWDDWVFVLIGTAIPTSLLIIRDVRQRTAGRQESRA